MVLTDVFYTSIKLETADSFTVALAISEVI